MAQVSRDDLISIIRDAPDDHTFLLIDTDPTPDTPASSGFQIWSTSRSGGELFEMVRKAYDLMKPKWMP